MSEIFRDDGVERDAKLAALYQAAAREEPPPALDDAVRAAARRAVASRPQRVSSSFIRSWRLPLSIAAVMMLTVSLVTVMREEAPEIMLPSGGLLDDVDHKRAAPAADIGESATAVPKTSGPHAQRSDSVGLRPPAQSGSSGIGLRDGRVAPERAAESRKNMAAADAMTPAPAPAPLPATIPAPAAGAAAEGKVQSKSEPASADTALRESSRARAKADIQPSAAPPASRMAGAIQPRAELAPDKWLERIEELRRQGKLEEARTSLAEFRKRFPNHELPASFKDWAGP